MKIAALVSGGVDSSTALRLLEEEDHDVTAFYLKIWLEDELQHLSACPWQEDLDHIRGVCRDANIQLEILSFQRHYYERVVENVIAEVKAGRTPNPDVWCNNRIKFGLFADCITGFDKIASGHYAQLAEVDGQLTLKQAPDPVKDQTYFLSHLPPETLPKLMFPIGHLQKSEVRSLAKEFALPNADRKDSQGICFLGKFKYRDFLKYHIGTKTGDFVEFETGKKLGKHDGFWFYTHGQRRGIGLSGGPWFVVGKNTQTNVVFISRQYHETHLARKTFTGTNCNWFLGNLENGFYDIKLRHGPEMHRGEMMGLDNNEIQVILNHNDQGIAPGQFAAFYRDGICLGSAVIAS